MKYRRESWSFGRSVRLHRAKAERALGHKLDSKHPVHHVDGNELNDDNSNLVICENMSYHRLLDTRGKAYRATGDPSSLKCEHCKQWDSLGNLYTKGYHTYHRSCNAEASRRNRA